MISLRDLSLRLSERRLSGFTWFYSRLSGIRQNAGSGDGRYRRIDIGRLDCRRDAACAGKRPGPCGVQCGTLPLHKERLVLPCKLLITIGSSKWGGDSNSTGASKNHQAGVGKCVRDMDT